MNNLTILRRDTPELRATLRAYEATHIVGVMAQVELGQGVENDGLAAMLARRRRAQDIGAN